MIGLDTSHVVAFTNLLNKDNKGPMENIRVVAAFPAGSPDLPISADRLAGFTKTLKEKHKVEIVGSIAELLPKVDAVFLESVDGRVHLEQLKPVFAAGKPVFIDKPVAASLADTIEIFELAAKHKVPCFSSSSLRFSDKLKALANDPAVGKLQRCETTGPVNPLKGHPELFFYGIHGIEMLFTVLGSGCQTVTWKDGVVTGTWKDGRIGTFRSDKGYTAKVTGDKATAQSGGGDYNGLVKAISIFLRDGKPPVSAEETINLVAFMVAAEESKKMGGQPVAIAGVMKQARDEIAARSKTGK
ncbi:MAG: gfo/Idh/MocA family oxidoreductase [Planctomycetia bacterium]|nr:gfo/Idh/MocA family oxidoreductase [Planctomycetia bacterium]